MLESWYHGSFMGRAQGEAGGPGSAGAAVHASALLLEVTRDPDAAVLARWLPAAEAVAEAAAVLAASADTLPVASAQCL
jgi:hypothetical protein